MLLTQKYEAHVQIHVIYTSCKISTFQYVWYEVG